MKCLRLAAEFQATLLRASLARSADSQAGSVAIAGVVAVASECNCGVGGVYTPCLHVSSSFVLAVGR